MLKQCANCLPTEASTVNLSPIWGQKWRNFTILFPIFLHYNSFSNFPILPPPYHLFHFYSGLYKAIYGAGLSLFHSSGWSSKVRSRLAVPLMLTSGSVTTCPVPSTSILDLTIPNTSVKEMSKWMFAKYSPVTGPFAEACFGLWNCVCPRTGTYQMMPDVWAEFSKTFTLRW